MELQTRVEIPPSTVRIDYTRKLAFIGSCFAQNISEKFTRLKFRTLVNPFGIIYNPLSIEYMVERIVNGETYSARDVQEGNVFLDGENWNCWDFHGSFSAKDENSCIEGLNAAVLGAREYLKSADVVFITLGTAFVYFLKQTGNVVSNCHRRNADLFDRQLISVERAADALNSVVCNLRRLNPDVKEVFTVSPLRHLKDGAHGNNLSKSSLLLAVDQVVKANPQVEYFPSYEIVLDELRDYRFYDSDMIHLSEVAEDYIFERLQETYFDEAVRENVKRVEKFLKSANHRIVDAASSMNKAFASKHLDIARDLEKRIPGLDLSAEKTYFLSL
ncbi:MAG: GSCFA domain-containing protein [Fibrobacter sp.]|nr:GSCFA domain-containing protein [Fibrobacter sp.]